jgi:hypothetical protein
MRVVFSNGYFVKLPSEYTLEERLELVNEIIASSPSDFSYYSKMFDIKCGVRQDNNRLVKLRLDILGTYLIRSDENYTDDVMSRYKEVNRPLQERAFSQFSEDVQDLNGMR